MRTLIVAIFQFVVLHSAFAFEGRINATITQGSQSEAFLYTIGTNFVRVENTATNWPNPVDILDRTTGELIVLFPNNGSFVRLKSATKNSSPAPPGFPKMPEGFPARVSPPTPPAGAPAIPNLPALQANASTNLPPMPVRPPMHVGPNLPPPVAPQSAPGAPIIPPMPMMPPTMMGPAELHETGDKTNLLGLDCKQYEIKYAGQTMEVWATDQLCPFQPYIQSQSHHFGPRLTEEQWPALLAARKLFPLLANLRLDHGAQQFRLEVQSVQSQKLTDEDAKLFRPPTNYFEIQARPY